MVADSLTGEPRPAIALLVYRSPDEPVLLVFPVEPGEDGVCWCCGNKLKP